MVYLTKIQCYNYLLVGEFGCRWDSNFCRNSPYKSLRRGEAPLVINSLTFSSSLPSIMSTKRVSIFHILILIPFPPAAVFEDHIEIPARLTPDCRLRSRFTAACKVLSLVPTHN